MPCPLDERSEEENHREKQVRNLIKMLNKSKRDTGEGAWKMCSVCRLCGNNVVITKKERIRRHFSRKERVQNDEGTQGYAECHWGVSQLQTLNQKRQKIRWKERQTVAGICHHSFPLGEAICVWFIWQELLCSCPFC